jgi:hypothetical protein
MRPFLAILLAAAPAFADWEGRARFTFTPPRPGQGPLADGRIHMKRGKIRIEQKGPMGEMAIVFNLSTKKLDLLLLERKQYMELDQSMSAATVPPVCSGGTPAGCLAAQGFKRTGAEAMEGRKTSIWEQQRDTPMGKIEQRLWIVDGARELMFLRQVTKSDRGSARTDVLDAEEKPQPDSLFRVPADFTRLQARPAD